MKKNHGENSSFSRQDQKLVALIAEHFPVWKMSKEEKQILIEDKTGLINRILFKPFISQFHSGYQSELDLKKWWESFYKKYFDLIVDLSDVKIPDYDEIFNWVLIIAQGITIDMVIKVIKKAMNAYSGIEDLLKNDELINFRDPKNGSYAVRCLKQIEASASLDEPKHYRRRKNIGRYRITALERLIMELVYFEETGRHLDNHGHTMCFGSFFSKSGKTIYIDFNQGSLTIFPADFETYNWDTRAVKTCELNIYSTVADTSKK